MGTVDLSAVSDENRALAQKIAESAHTNLRDCYQCGKCSAGCPMAEDMDMRPQQVMRHLQMGLVQEVLEAQGPWMCAQCTVCSARCPQNIEIADVMRAVRLESKARGYQPLKEGDIFDDLFIRKVRKHGRSNEQWLAAFYNLESGHLLQDMNSAPTMFLKGLVGIAPHSTKDPEAVARLIDRCTGAQEAGEQQ